MRYNCFCIGESIVKKQCFTKKGVNHVIVSWFNIIALSNVTMQVVITARALVAWVGGYLQTTLSLIECGHVFSTANDCKQAVASSFHNMCLTVSRIWIGHLSVVHFFGCLLGAVDENTHLINNCFYKHKKLTYITLSFVPVVLVWLGSGFSIVYLVLDLCACSHDITQ